MYTDVHPTMAPAVMMPSMPRLRTPARSHTSSPRVPKTSGVAMRRAAAQKLAVTRISSGSVIAGPDSGLRKRRAACR